MRLALNLVGTTPMSHGILIVDDQQDLAQMTAQLLTDDGCTP